MTEGKIGNSRLALPYILLEYEESQRGRRGGGGGGRGRKRKRGKCGDKGKIGE